MSLYEQFKTNVALEKEGIWINYGENSAGKPIRIRVARSGGSNMKYAKCMERLARPYRRQIQNETIEPEVLEDLLQKVYAETVVLGWEGVEDEQGREMAFTQENCLKLLKDLPELFRDIQEQTQRAALFREAVREDDAKN